MTGLKPGRAASAIFISLDQHVRQMDAGEAINDGIGFLVNLPHRRSFCPDAAFFVGADSGMKFLEGAPVFAVEVRSENDYGPAAEREMEAKRADYFEAGTLVVWDVDLLSDDVVRAYKGDAEHPATVFRRGQMADAEPAVPGWRMAVDSLFKARKTAT